MNLARQVLSGDTRAVARAISIVELEGAESNRLIGLLHANTGHAHVVGFTGPPGVGKSCLVDRLTRLWRKAKLKVAVLAVDPTSPFTGGALLGDRIRMQCHTLDPGVFFRSMATRGQLGGLAPTTHDAASILDAAGFDVVVIETVGVGQGEVDISCAAHMSVVVVAPGAGDDVQAIKAGVMEIADVFVVNKSDRDGADSTASEIEAMLRARGIEKDTLLTYTALAQQLCLAADVPQSAGSDTPTRCRCPTVTMDPKGNRFTATTGNPRGTTRGARTVCGAGSAT